MKSFEVIKNLSPLINEDDIIISSNGNISREAFHHLAKPQVYLRGSMGLPVSVGLGLAIANPQKRILVITGDGNFLMGFGSSITAAYYKPDNLKVLILDNSKYFTTGGQETVSPALDYAKFLESLKTEAKSKKAEENQIKDDLMQLLEAKKFSILHLKIEEGKEQLENIPWHPKEIAKRFTSRIKQ